MAVVSIIVPVFNVEKYIRLCLESLQKQTLKDIEIIVIDDGSTDKCGVICDEYAKRDNRFKVYHTENRGLSAARNLGIDKSQSQWIMFADSDDWVDCDFCKLPYETAMHDNVDLVIFQRTLVTEKGRVKKKKGIQTPVGIISKEQAIDYGDVAVWNKLYKKDLFNHITHKIS